MNNTNNQTEMSSLPIEGEILGVENKNSDEIEEKGLNTYYTSNIIKKTFFLWTLYATQLANKNSLKIPDFQSIREEDRAETCFRKMAY